MQLPGKLTSPWTANLLERRIYKLNSLYLALFFLLVPVVALLALLGQPAFFHYAAATRERGENEEGREERTVKLCKTNFLFLVDLWEDEDVRVKRSRRDVQQFVGAFFAYVKYL